MDMYGKYDGHIIPYCMCLYAVSFQGVIIRPRGAGHDDTLDCALCHYAIHSDLSSLDIQKSAECAVGFIPHHVCVEIVYNIVLSYEYAYIIMLKVCLICYSIHYILLYIELIDIYIYIYVSISLYYNYIYIYISISIYLYIYISIYLYLYLYIYIYISIYLYIYISIYLYIYISIYLYICISIYWYLFIGWVAPIPGWPSTGLPFRAPHSPACRRRCGAWTSTNRRTIRSRPASPAARGQRAEGSRASHHGGPRRGPKKGHDVPIIEDFPSDTSIYQW